MSMNQGSSSLPGSEATTPNRTAVSASRNAVSFLLAKGSDSRRESRRIAAGLLALAVLSIALLNIGIYSSAQNRLQADGWSRLVANTEGKRQEIVDVLDRVESQAIYVAEQPMVLDWAQLAASGALFKVERNGLIDELDRSAESFGFQSFALYSLEGEQLVAGATAPKPHPETSDLVKRAAGTGRNQIAELHHTERGWALVSVAVPMVIEGFDKTPTVLVGHVLIADVLHPVLSAWPGFKSSAGAYLVAREGEQLVYISAPPGPDAVWRGTHARIGDPSARAAAMAVVGVESNVEVVGADQRDVWAVTRSVPGLEWGLVGQADRADMMAGMRGTLFGLLLLDLAMALLGASAFWFWKRQYATGLARSEMNITRRHAERVQAIFDTAFDAIVTFGGDGRVRTVNRAAERLFGCAASDMQGEPIKNYLRTSSGRAHEPGGPSEDRASDSPGAVMRSEAVHSDGSVVPVEYSLGRAGEGDELVHTAILRDVRERVESERRIRDFAEGLEASNRRLEEVNAQLEEASRLKSEFLANTSHELRTPLNGMIGFLQLVLDGMCDTREEERDYQRQAMQCSKHLLGLINDVLDIAKIEAGKLTVEIGRVDAQHLFEEVYTITHVQAAQKGIKLNFDVPETDSAVRGDFGKIKQIIVNLVGNSLKFTPSGAITVRATPHPELGHFMFEVIDTGIGIPENRQRVIFEKFTQGDGSTTRRFGGTGLGLAISKSLVELMGGIIGVESEGEGKGTRMYFSLPLWSDEELEAVSEVQEGEEDQIHGPSGGSLALIVEDDTAFRKYLVALLNQRGYRTIEAKSAESGWLLARRLHPAVIVLDYALTSAESAVMRTGWDLAERIAKHEQTRHIPMIFVTGFEAEVQEKLRSTAFAKKPAHLVKPIEGSALIERIEQMVGDESDAMIRILMADDDPSVAAYIRKVLPEDRFLVEMATNGEECLQILRAQPNGFDLLLLDLMMPEVSGWDVLREMALANVHKDLPVLVLTNYPEPRSDEERRLLEDGLVLEVVPKSKVHENPKMLGHVIDWHLQVSEEGDGDSKDGQERAA